MANGHDLPFCHPDGGREMYAQGLLRMAHIE